MNMSNPQHMENNNYNNLFNNYNLLGAQCVKQSFTNSSAYIGSLVQPSLCDSVTYLLHTSRDCASDLQ